LEPIRETPLSFEDWDLAALDVRIRMQGFFEKFWETAFHGFQNDTDRHGILDQLANILVQELQNFLKLGLSVF